MKPKDKSTEYAQKLLFHIKQIFEDDCENQISKDELMENDNMKSFFHALSTMVPTHIHNAFMKNELDHLGFNQLSNRLVFEFSGKTEQS